jgi:hypothetical protein
MVLSNIKYSWSEGIRVNSLQELGTNGKIFVRFSFEDEAITEFIIEKTSG